MIYLYWYLVIGAVVLVIVFGTHWLTKKDESDSFRELLDAVDPARKKLSYRILSDFVVPVLSAVAVVVVWPAAIYMKGREIFLKKCEDVQEEDQRFAVNKNQESALKDEEEFAVERSHLQERLTVPQIEARELVADPLGAVSNAPFGHLNTAWKNFIEGLDADNDIWSFAASWETPWGRKEIRSGYIAVRDGAPSKYFFTMWKTIGDE